MAWIYLLIAAVFEIAWTFSLKFMDVKKVRAIHWQQFFARKEYVLALAPFMGYLLFGLGNVLFFSMAMKQIPAASALAIWMGMTIIGLKLLEMGIYREPYDLWQFFFLALIVIGIAGLKRT